MIADLDEALRQLLIRELPVKNSEVDIKFDQPRRDWSSRVSKPTLNLFLHDVRENTTLREPQWEIERNGDGSVTKRRSAVRVDLHYMITAWVADHPEDEHRLLTRALLALFRTPTLPEDLLPESLQDQPVPIPIRAAQQEEYRAPADIWSALDNELRPAIACTVTLALNPYKRIPGPLVRSRELRVGRAVGRFDGSEPDEAAGQDRFWMVGGTVKSKGTLQEARVRLVERGQDTPLQADGRFIIGNLEAGDHTLEVWDDGNRLRTRKIRVPAEEYDIEV
jgi:hypothetical protein